MLTLPSLNAFQFDIAFKITNSVRDVLGLQAEDVVLMPVQVTKSLFESPREAYTRALMSAAFDLEARESEAVAS